MFNLLLVIIILLLIAMLFLALLHRFMTGATVYRALKVIHSPNIDISDKNNKKSTIVMYVIA